MINIDGSLGEGGGQILRTSLALSTLTGKPFSINNIRATRPRAGLKRQHLTCVKAAAKISNAKLKGNHLNSMNLKFTPGKVQSGEYHFSVGSAGSTTLVLQTILPPLMLADGESFITLEGGTHNPLAPSYDFLEKCFFPQLRKHGVELSSKIITHGFYPGGGGCFQVKIKPTKKLKAFNLQERGQLIRRRACSLVAEIPLSVAQREVKKVQQKMKWHDTELEVTEIERTFGPGNTLMLEVNYENVCEITSSFGERGIRAETIALKAVTKLKNYLKSNAPVGEYLADQLLLPFALAAEGSFTCTELSQHTKTNIEVIKYFLNTKISTTQLGRDKFQIRFLS